uniref:Uncharacterized protein n=1 Tax=Rhizophora mucronata TaxID=61149 RepID=A0A2P2P4K9_RHIMU
MRTLATGHDFIASQGNDCTVYYLIVILTILSSILGIMVTNS